MRPGHCRGLKTNVIDTATNSVVHTITVGGDPYGVVFSPDGGHAYEASGGSVSVIDTATNSVIDTINVGTTAVGIAISHDGSQLYVTHYTASDTVSVIDTATDKVIGTINTGHVPIFPGVLDIAPAVTAGLVSDTGVLATDKITSNDALTGSGDPNAVVHFTVDGQPIFATTTADNTGQWNFTPTGLADGQHTIVASETDFVGNTGTASLSFRLDTTAAAVMAGLVNDTGTLANDRITKDASLTGSGDANAVVHFTVDGQPILATTTADANGGWSFVPSGLLDGNHTIVASETDAAGNTGTASASFTLDTTVPIDVLTSDTRNGNGWFRLTGASEANSTIKIFDGSKLLGSTTADSIGQWSYTTSALSKATVHSFTSTATDVAGNVGHSSGATIYGTGGNNTIHSTSGSDLLTGGGGVDTFVFSSTNFGKDVITDFQASWFRP